MTWRTITGLLILAGTTLISGCGDGGKSNSTTAVVAFSIVSTAQLPARINGVNIAIILPEGVSAPTDATDPKQIAATALAAGSAMDSIPDAGKLVMGSYSSAGRLVRIVALGPSGFGPGEYARLTCVADPGVIVSENGITQLNTPPVTFRVTGYDADTHSSVDLTSLLRPHFNLK